MKRMMEDCFNATIQGLEEYTKSIERWITAASNRNIDRLNLRTKRKTTNLYGYFKRQT